MHPYIQHSKEKKKKKEPNVLKEKGLADYYLFIIKTYK